MTLLLIVQAILGLPIDRGIDEAIHVAAAKEPNQAIMLAATVNSTVTIWFWLTLNANPEGAVRPPSRGFTPGY
jgi:hypothetical protein